jgi:hypothetical protein
MISKLFFARRHFLLSLSVNQLFSLIVAWVGGRPGPRWRHIAPWCGRVMQSSGSLQYDIVANFGEEDAPERIIGTFSQELLPEMIGKTQPRVSHFMNKFRELG